MNLIDKQKRSLALLSVISRFLDGGSNILYAAQNSRQGDKMGLALTRDQSCQRGFTGAGWPPKDQGVELTLFNQQTKRSVRTQQMILTGYCIERLRPHARR